MSENKIIRPREEILLENPNISSQQAIVNLMLPPKTATVVHRTVPGGKRLFETPLTEDMLAAKLYTWLRHVKTFSDVTVGFSKDPSQYKTTTETLMDLPVSSFNIWDLPGPNGGKQWLANRLASFILKNKGLSFVVTKDKIKVVKEVPKKDGKELKYEFSTTCDDFEPYLEFTTVRN